MRLAARLLVGSSLLLAATVVGLIVAADHVLRWHLEADIATGLEHEARLVATLLPPDSLAWPDAPRRLGALIGHRLTLIDPKGRVRGDTEFDRAALAQLENHAGRPEVVQALATGAGRDQRLSASTNERRLYVAVRGGPPGLAVVRVSTTLAAVDAAIDAVQRGVALAGLAALAVAALLAWALSGTIARPLVQLGTAARAIAAGEAPEFPDARIPEIADHVLALRAMHQQLDQRFAELRREREETHTLIESMADGVLAADPLDALLRRDSDLAAQVIAGDHAIDALELKIEELVIDLFATQQPMARDLRLLMAAMKIANDLERVGDHAANIAQSTERLAAARLVPPEPELLEMARQARAMLSGALAAFVKGDSKLGREICRRDDLVDALHHSVFRILLTHMMEDPHVIGAAMELFLVSRNLERVADLATNIAEDVVFLVEGKTIKHHAEEA